MIQKIYSIYDRVTSDHALPFVAPSNASAERTVKGAFNPQSQLVLYPSDYELVCLGDFDSETGQISAAYAVVSDIKNLIPVFLRTCALDGTFEGSVNDVQEKKDTSAQSKKAV